MLKYERRQITLNLLEQLKLVTTILYFISCRTGYTIEFVSARYEIDVQLNVFTFLCLKIDEKRHQSIA